MIYKIEVRRLHRALFIGEETGGGYYGNTSGDEAMVVLPSTRIICRIQKVKYIMALREISEKDRGVIPDVPVYITINDLTENKDSQLEHALKFIRQDQSLASKADQTLKVYLFVVLIFCFNSWQSYADSI